MTKRVTEVERQGLVFDVADQGPLDGEPVVLLRGSPERASSWDQVAEILNGAGHRTLGWTSAPTAPAPARRGGATTRSPSW